MPDLKRTKTAFLDGVDSAIRPFASLWFQSTSALSISDPEQLLESVVEHLDVQLQLEMKSSAKSSEKPPRPASDRDRNSTDRDRNRNRDGRGKKSGKSSNTSAHDSKPCSHCHKTNHLSDQCLSLKKNQEARKGSACYLHPGASHTNADCRVKCGNCGGHHYDDKCTQGKDSNSPEKKGKRNTERSAASHDLRQLSPSVADGTANLPDALSSDEFSSAGLRQVHCSSKCRAKFRGIR